jgi:hypothetical protein
MRGNTSEASYTNFYGKNTINFIRDQGFPEKFVGPGEPPIWDHTSHCIPIATTDQTHRNIYQPYSYQFEFKFCAEKKTLNFKIFYTITTAIIIRRDNRQ